MLEEWERNEHDQQGKVYHLMQINIKITNNIYTSTENLLDDSLLRLYEYISFI